MKLEHLLAHGFSLRTVEAWKRTREPELLPLQAHAVTRSGLLHGRSVGVFAPTSAGKTFVGELAAMRHVERGGRAVFLVPTRALAEELATHLIQTYTSLGLRICLSTSEHRTQDNQIAAGEFDLGVLVYEKLRALLVAFPELAPLFTCVVADELQILGDAERGALVDIILTKLKLCHQQPQIVAMSAVMDDHERLTSWLGAEPIVWHERPVELREGVFDCEKGLFHYREWNSRQESVEVLCSPALLDGALADTATFAFPHVDAAMVASVIALARELVERRGEQLLVFVPTKALSRQLAEKLANVLRLHTPPTDHAEELAVADDSIQTELIRRLMVCGVCFHNADLPFQTRRVVEEAFEQGTARVLVATSTLAQGVNLTCQNVVSLPTMIVQGEVASQPVMVPLSRAKLRNQGGRAGRYKRASFGRSIVVARNSAEAQRLRELMFQGQAEPVTPRLTSDALAAAVLDFIVTRRHSPQPADPTAVAQFASNMFSAKVMDFPTLHKAAEGVLTWLAGYELVAPNHNGFVATACGEIAAAYGLDAPTIGVLREAIDLFEAMPPRDEIPILLAAACTPKAMAFPVCATPWEIRSGKYLHLYCDYLRQTSEESHERHILQLPGGGASARDHSALKKTFLAQAWVSERPTRAIEQAFGVLAGSIMDLAHNLAWLVEALGALATRLGKNPQIHGACINLSERLRFGVTESALPLAKVLGGKVGRSHLLKLVGQGFDTLSALEETDNITLGHVVPQPVVRAIREAIARSRSSDGGKGNGLALCSSAQQQLISVGPPHSAGEKCEPPPADAKMSGRQPPRGVERPTAESSSGAPSSGQMRNVATDASAHWAPPQMEIDEKSPGVVRLNGERVFLSVLPYRLLVYLAKRPQQVVSYSEIDEHLWPNAKVEQQQILSHKTTIVKRLGEVVGMEQARALVRTVAGHGLFLDLPASHVHVK